MKLTLIHIPSQMQKEISAWNKAVEIKINQEKKDNAAEWHDALPNTESRTKFPGRVCITVIYWTVDGQIHVREIGSPSEELGIVRVCWMSQGLSKGTPTAWNDTIE